MRAFVDVDDQEDLDVDDGPPEEYYRQQVDALGYRLEQFPPTDPVLRSRLEADLERTVRALLAITIDQHWASGEGDRLLF